MKKPQLFLNKMSKDQKEFLNLLDLTAKVHGENRSSLAKEGSPIWGEEFFHLKSATVWKSLTDEDQRIILINLGQKILQEAYFIENAGMAYAGKMNLAAKTKEEREFFCFVGEEEARHLRMVEALSSFPTSLDTIPSFALLIGEIIQEAGKVSHLLLIQILLEGWGLNYYKSLQKMSLDENVSNVFKAILKDEIRHHSAGVILFNTHKNQTGMSKEDADEFLSYLERIAFMVKIGPYSACEEIFSRYPSATKSELKVFLEETSAITVTAGKMELLGELIGKALPLEVIAQIKEKGILKALDLSEMTDILYQSMPKIFRPDQG